MVCIVFGYLSIIHMSNMIISYDSITPWRMAKNRMCWGSSYRKLCDHFQGIRRKFKLLIKRNKSKANAYLRFRDGQSHWGLGIPVTQTVAKIFIWRTFDGCKTAAVNWFSEILWCSVMATSRCKQHYNRYVRFVSSINRESLTCYREDVRACQ